MSESISPSLAQVQQDIAKWGWIRFFFWPIHRSELKKFSAFALLLFFIFFTSVSGSFLMSALFMKHAELGAGGMTLSDTWGSAGLVIFFFALYLLLKLFETRTVILISVGFFITLFGGVTLILFSQSTTGVPESMTFALFSFLFILWKGFAVAFIFWLLANEFTEIEQAKRLYPFIVWLSLVFSLFAYNSLGLEVSLSLKPLLLFIGALVCMGGLVLYISFCLKKPLRTLISQKAQQPQAESTSQKPVSPTTYLSLLSLLVICPILLSHFLTIAWKANIFLAYGAPKEYGKFLADSAVLHTYIIIPYSLFI